MEKPEIWQSIQAHVDKMGIKKSRLARELELSDTTIGLYLQGERKLSKENEKKLLDFLSLGVAEK